MNLHQIRYFLRLADKLHFWQTAEDMNITQSALSRQIRQLEEEVGFRLFDRTQRSVRLTEAGKVLQVEWARLLTEFEAVQRHARQVSNGEIGSLRVGHIGSVSYAWLPQLLKAFTSRCPLVELELVEVSASESEQRLLTYQLDVGFWREPPQNPSLTYKAIFSEPFTLVVPQDHPVQPDTFGSLADLRDESFILPSLSDYSGYGQELRQLFEQYGFLPRYTIISDFGTTILNLVAAGLGVSVLPHSYASSPVRGLRYLPLPHETTVFMTWRLANSSAVLQQLLAEAMKLERLY